MSKAVVKIGMGTFDKDTCCLWCKRKFKNHGPNDAPEGWSSIVDVTRGQHLSDEQWRYVVDQLEKIYINAEKIKHAN